HDVLTCYRAAGNAGIPRPQVLGFVRDAAEALDLMNFQHGLQHLDVKPRNLFVAGNQVKVADFGLVSSLSGKRGEGIPLSAVSPLYAAPEIFRGAISRDSDQYSLAIVFQELLTGTLPFGGTNVRQLLLQHTTQEPDLSALPACDRPVVARALAKNPKNRYGSCAEFVRALTASGVLAGLRAKANAARSPAGKDDQSPPARRCVRSETDLASRPATASSISQWPIQ